MVAFILLRNAIYCVKPGLNTGGKSSEEGRWRHSHLHKVFQINDWIICLLKKFSPVYSVSVSIVHKQHGELSPRDGSDHCSKEETLRMKQKYNVEPPYIGANVKTNKARLT